MGSKVLTIESILATVDFSPYPDGFDLWYASRVECYKDFTLTPEQAYGMSQGVCADCGFTDMESPYHVGVFKFTDIVTKVAGGGYTEGNTETLCKSCEDKKNYEYWKNTRMGIEHCEEFYTSHGIYQGKRFG